jgi:hypothetical protein
MGKATIWLTVSTLVTALPSGCSGETKTATSTPEATIPASFTTYTREGLFSISYPSHWDSATPWTDEQFEKIKEALESMDPDATVPGMTVLFRAGEPNDAYLLVRITIVPAPSTGYRTLEELVEARDAHARTWTPGYQVVSQTRTTVDRREAVIENLVANWPGRGRPWRFLQMIMVKDKLVWIVTCGSEYDDFESYEETFKAISGSLRLLE